MPKLKCQFRPVNSELYGNATPSGTCLDALNTVIGGNSTLSGRIGFDVFENNTGAYGKILNMFVATFTDGDVYLITKRSDGKLYQWKVYPVAATAWTAIVDKWSNHSTADAGWFFMWADRMYYFDRIGGTKWIPHATDVDAGTTYKAGIEATISPTIAAASGGGKEGRYHIGHTNVNQRTGEESAMGGLQGGLQTRLSPATGGKINITNWKSTGAGIADKTSDQNYEYDAVRIYCTMGNTEHIGLGAGDEQFSYQLFSEVLVLKSVAGASFAPIFRADQIVSRNPMLTNRGGQPPGAVYGCYNGSQAIYLKVYPKAKDNPTLTNLGDFVTEAPDIMMYSVPGYPAMVPQTRTYDLGSIDDLKNFVPRGGPHEIPSNIAGLITGCGALGNSFLVFTNSSTYALTPNSSGHMKPLLVDPAHGAVGYGPVVSTGSAVHAFGKDAWLRIGRQGVQNVSQDAFTPVMEAVPNASITVTVGGYYSHKSQVWFAVAKTGGTASKAQRILIWDEQLGGLVNTFDPANLSTAGITAMVELSHPAQAPVMLVALDTGVILQWPGSQYTDEIVGSTNLGYACSWQGLFGQENRAYDQKLGRIDVHMKDNVTTGIILGVSGHTCASRVGTDALVEKTIPLTKANLTDRVGVEFDPRCDGNIFELKISSTIAQGAQWKVGDMIMDIDRV